MDKFTEKAFALALELCDQRVAEKYGQWAADHGKAADLAALLAAGIRESAKMVATIDKAGLLETLRSYADYMAMAGFHAGYEAGYANALEDTK